MKESTQKRLPYQVIRSRRSTADIIIERDGSVLVRAPEWADDEQIQNVVESKHYWIFQALAEWKDLNATRVLREYKNGEGFPYLGRAYRLGIVGDQDEDLVLKSGRFLLRQELAASGDIEAARTAFHSFYTSKGETRIIERVRYYAPKVGVEAGAVEVKDLGYRWASCSKSGDLAFHWKCMMAPMSIIDYIVVHELCHLHHRDHTTEFWNEVDKILPDYRQRKATLREIGAGFEL